MPEQGLDADLLAGAFDALPDAVTLATAVRDADGRALDLRLLGLSARARARHADVQTAAGRLVSEVWPDMQEDGSLAACLRVLHKGEPESFMRVDEHALRPGGEAWRAMRVVDDVVLLWVPGDLGDRARAEREAQDAEERWRQVVAGFEQAVLDERRDAEAGLRTDDAPWPGFGVAAADVTHYLDDVLDLDLWLVTHVEGEQQTVVASAGAWSDLAPPGTTFAWADSFCIRMVEQGGATVVRDVRTVPRYAEAATGLLAQVRAYVGVPITGDGGRLFGTLLGLGGDPGTDDLLPSLHLVTLVGRMLSTVRAREEFAQARSEDAAAAYALAERDRVTGTRNRRGWEAALAVEEARCRRYGSPASVLVVDLDDLHERIAAGGHAAGDALLRRCAAVLLGGSRPGDVLGRLGGGALAVLAVECDAPCVTSLLTRLREQLRDDGIAASAGAATRRTGENLVETVERAQEEMRLDQRRHPRHRAGATS